MVTVVGRVVGGGGGVDGGGVGGGVGGGGVGGGATVVGAVVVFLVEVAVLLRTVDAVVLGAVVVVFDARVDCVAEEGGGVEEFELPTRKAMATPAAPAARSSAASTSASGTGRRRPPPGSPRGITCVGADAATIVGASLSVAAGPAASARTSASPSSGRACGSFASDASASATSAAGAAGRASARGNGLSWMCIRASSSGLSDSNGSRPASSRYKMTPNE
jgi:hypothetical protein